MRRRRESLQQRCGVDLLVHWLSSAAVPQWCTFVFSRSSLPPPYYIPLIIFFSYWLQSFRSSSIIHSFFFCSCFAVPLYFASSSPPLCRRFFSSSYTLEKLCLHLARLVCLWFCLQFVHLYEYHLIFETRIESGWHHRRGSRFKSPTRSWRVCHAHGGGESRGYELLFSDAVLNQPTPKLRAHALTITEWRGRKKYLAFFFL